MLRLLFDQDFNHDILRGLLLRLPDVDGVTALQGSTNCIELGELNTAQFGY